MAKPVAPNFTDLATQQGALNKQTALDIAGANRYTQVGAAGDSNAWTTDPTTGAVTNTTTMGAKPQAYYDALMNTGTAATNSFANKYYGPGAAQGATPGGISVNIPNSTGNAAGSPVGKGIQTDLDYSKLTAMPGEDIGAARQQAQDALYGRSAGYLDPQWQETQRSTETQLRNKGFTPGTPAYDRAYANMARAKEAAYTGARQDAIAGGGLEAQRAQEMALQLRNQGVTEAGNLGAFHNAAQGQGADQWLKKYGYDTSKDATLGAAGISAGASMANNAANNAIALRQQEYLESTGLGKSAQEYLPQFGIDQGNVGKYDPADVYGAGLEQYKDQVERANAAAKKKGGILGSVLGIAGGLAGNYLAPGIGGTLGAKLGSSLGSSLSDVRLKSNIWPVGRTPGGHNVYDYDIGGRRERGVMAQEVGRMLPEAVTRGDDGFLRVDYSKVR
jgi:hypothetical protein